MGHKKIDVRQVIPAPPAAVFATLLDRSEWPAWSGHTKFELVRPGAAGPYDVGSVGLLSSGRRRVMREEIVEVVGDRRVGDPAGSVPRTVQRLNLIDRRGGPGSGHAKLWPVLPGRPGEHSKPQKDIHEVGHGSSR